ncbi:MAG TPA: alpha/beta hydrolase-fold protein [Opitutaceae bacterium]|nr:alpha/beta hydrolase-fold protein [Opitutaceae bacterium]
MNPARLSWPALLAACLLAATAAAAQITVPATSTPTTKPAAVAPKSPIRQDRLQSVVLGEERRLVVRLPYDYETNLAARYPVLFKLDGDSGLRRYHETIAELSSRGAIPDLIVVAITNAPGQRERDMTPASLHQEADPTGKMGTGAMGGGDRFLDFMEKELIPYVERNYRTTGPRLLAGHSRSALLTVQSLLSQPDLFHARFVFSAPLMRDEQRLIADTRAFLAATPQHRSFIYFNWGTAENEGMGRSHDAMLALVREQAPGGLRWLIERAPGADHQETPLAAIPGALQGFFRDWRPAATGRKRD